MIIIFLHTQNKQKQVLSPYQQVNTKSNYSTKALVLNRISLPDVLSLPRCE